MSISLAVGGLAYLVPKIAGWLAGDKAEEAASAIAEVAMNITGTSSVPDALKAINTDPTVALEFQRLMADKETAFDKLYLEDRQNAREMYKEQNTAADSIATAVMKYNLMYIIAVGIGQCVALYMLRDHSEVLAAVTSLATWIVKGLLDERKEVTGFYFGSSLGSRIKDR